MATDKEALQGAMAVGVAGIGATLHLLRIMTNRGFVSPNEVDTVYSSILDTMDAAPPQMAAIVSAQLDNAVPGIRATAQERWAGKGKSNPS